MLMQLPTVDCTQDEKGKQDESDQIKTDQRYFIPSELVRFSSSGWFIQFFFNIHVDIMV